MSRAALLVLADGRFPRRRARPLRRGGGRRPCRADHRGGEPGGLLPGAAAHHGAGVGRAGRLRRAGRGPGRPGRGGRRPHALACTARGGAQAGPSAAACRPCHLARHRTRRPGTAVPEGRAPAGGAGGGRTGSGHRPGGRGALRAVRERGRSRDRDGTAAEPRPVRRERGPRPAGPGGRPRGADGRTRGPPGHDGRRRRAPGDVGTPCWSSTPRRMRPARDACSRHERARVPARVRVAPGGSRGVVGAPRVPFTCRPEPRPDPPPPTRSRSTRRWPRLPEVPHAS